MNKIFRILLCISALAFFACSCSTQSVQSGSPVSHAGGSSDTATSSIVSSKPAVSSKVTSSALQSVAVESKPASKAPSTPSASDTSEPPAVSSVAPIGPPTVKYVAFTFDDGPHYIHTKSIADKFKKYGGACTFFVVGNRISEQNGAAVKYAADNGCEIGIHAYTHKHTYDKCTDAVFNEELSKTANAIHKFLPDYSIKLMRPVGGKITQKRIEACKYSVIMWNVDSEDWKYKGESPESSAESIRNNIIKDVKDGSIILMHEIYNNSDNALDSLLEEMYQQGYRFVTVSELIGEDNLRPGKKYNKR